MAAGCVTKGSWPATGTGEATWSTAPTWIAGQIWTTTAPRWRRCSITRAGNDTGTLAPITSAGQTEDPMTDLPQMAVYATRADAADTFLDELGPVPAHQEALVAAVRDLAEKLRITARRHVTVGFVGVWTTGKSLLISMLSGVPDLLPVSNAPATGNVTRIRITPVPAGHQAKRDGATVSLLSPAAVAEMADYIVREIVALVTKEGLPYDVRPLIGYQLVDRGNPSRPDLRPLTEFLSPLWPDPALNKQIRLWSTELFQIAGALRAGGHLLPASMPDTPRHIRDLGDAVLIGDGRRVPEQFPDPGHRAPILATELALPHNLQVIQPLIH